MRVLVAAAKIMARRVESAALSGKAALKLAQASQLDALTIAQVIKRLKLRDELEAEGRLDPNDDYLRDDDGIPTRRLPRFTSETTLLLDEASMVDVASLHRLLGRLPDGAGLLLAGDFSQLPPVGIGQVYHDLVAAQHGVVELTQILRQAGGNPLLDVAAAIRSGQVPALPKFAGATSGVQFHECALTDVADQLGVVRCRLAREVPQDDLLILSARKTTVASVCHGEMVRRQTEGVMGVRLGPLCAWISVGDPVMMAANHYKYGLANGQLGRVTSIDPVQVQWDGFGQSLKMEEDYRADVISAWAITCHKSQGSEAHRVLIALDSKYLLIPGAGRACRNASTKHLT
jgi:exodeoxyribonuclease V alpha subunit